MKEKAKELLLKKDFRNAFDVAEKCDQDDPEILYIKGRCLEEGVKRFRHGGLGAWHDFFAGDAGSHEALECYRNAYQNQSAYDPCICRKTQICAGKFCIFQ